MIFTSHPSLIFAEGTTRSGFDGHDNKREALGIFGDIDINKLALNIENLTATTKPKTHEFLRATSGTITALNFTGDNGKIKLNSKVRVREINLGLHQNIINGFFY